MADDAQVLEGRVTHVVFSNPESGFAVVRMHPAEGKDVVVVGSFGEVSEEDHLRTSGSWEEHQRFGRRFRAVTVQRVTPRTLDGIERYLCGPRVKGIGPALARRIVKHFGAETFEVLESQPRRLVEVEGIGASRADELVRVWEEEKTRRETMVFLQGHGVGPALAARIVETLGERTVESVRADPYVLVERVAGVGFRTADAIAMQLGYDRTGAPRLRAALIHLLDEAVGRGHLCLPGGELLRRAAGLLEVGEENLRPVLRRMTVDGEIVVARMEGAGEHRVYRCFAWEAEREAAGRLVDLARGGERVRRLSSLAAPADTSNLTDEQRDAVFEILDAKVSVLTGGPGVGKTTVLRTLVNVWRRAGLRVRLCCPTGRAARRMADASGLEASTVHRLLKFDGRRRRFVHDEDFPVKADQIVVDEASMLDLPLLVSLLRALTPDTRLLLIGDADQLPSVGPGTVLRDVVSSRAVPVHRLTRIFRQAAGSAIVELAHSILHGELDLDRAGGGDVEFIPCDDPVEGAATVRRLVLEDIPRRGAATAEDVQVLTPMHKGATGTRELNRMIQEARCPRDAGIRVGDDLFCVGDRVMQVRNDYDRELFNGDQGMVLSVDRERRVLVADFDGVQHQLSAEALRDVQPAWAISVHKSQGGEYPAVVLPLFSQHYLLLQRQVLYTAVTRAKRLLVIVGEERALHQAVARNDMAIRHGHLADRLAGAAEDVWRPRT